MHQLSTDIQQGIYQCSGGLNICSKHTVADLPLTKMTRTQVRNYKETDDLPLMQTTRNKTQPYNTREDADLSFMQTTKAEVRLCKEMWLVTAALPPASHVINSSMYKFKACPWVPLLPAAQIKQLFEKGWQAQ